MLALQISSMKIFMNQLLATNTFDGFLLEEATIKTANTVTIDGRIHREFFSEEELTGGCCPYEFQPWSEMKGLCFDLIKGRHTPLFFKFILHLKPDKIPALLPPEENADFSQVKALALNIRYDGSAAVLTTGTAYHTFVLSKEGDFIWDKAVINFLTQNNIPFEQL